MKPILIVEDEANIRGLIALTLRRSGYETVQADDPAMPANRQRSADAHKSGHTPWLPQLRCA